MSLNLNAFRLGDIRGVFPEEINEPFIHAFAHAFVGEFGLSGKVATGRDMRESSADLHEALNSVLAGIGIDVIDIGLCPTELGYFASGQPGVEAAIVVTASHNPAHYNGLKIVLQRGEAITFENGLDAIKRRMRDGYRHPSSGASIQKQDYHARFLEFLREHFPPETLAAGPIALNGLNGTAVTMAGKIAESFHLPVSWFRKDPGPMPAEGADPANPRLVAEMKSFMAGGDFALGVAWDGDCDRCVCFDNDGYLIPTYYLIGLLVENFLLKRPGSAIVFDTKLCWNTLDQIKRYGGRPVPSKTGHAFMKQKMHAHGAIYGGELSSHHYFGAFNGCDSGMMTWLTVLQLLGERPGSDIAQLVAERRQIINCTPEISVRLRDADTAFSTLEDHFTARALSVDHFDGLGFEMPGNWRFTVRHSKTEPAVRLNFEARQAPDLLLEAAATVLGMLEPFRDDDREWYASLRIQ